MKKNLLFTLNNGMEYHWYSAVGDSLYSFQQFIFAGSEIIQLGSNVRRVVYTHDLHGPAKKAFYHLLRRACGETDSLAGYKNPVLLKVTDQCDYGRLNLRTVITASKTGPDSVVPFYLQPSLGGVNTLRSYVDYRFHDDNMLVANAELRLALMTHVDFAMFADAGNVAARASGLDLAKRSYGGGFRFHTRRETFAMIDVATGDEGWKVHFRLKDPLSLGRIKKRAFLAPFVP